MSKFVQAGFLIFGLVFVSRDFEVHWSRKVAFAQKVSPIHREWKGRGHSEEGEGWEGKKGARMNLPIAKSYAR